MEGLNWMSNDKFTDEERIDFFQCTEEGYDLLRDGINISIKASPSCRCGMCRDYCIEIDGKQFWSGEKGLRNAIDEVIKFFKQRQK
jgi:hypothetical protein